MINVKWIVPALITLHVGAFFGFLLGYNKKFDSLKAVQSDYVRLKVEADRYHTMIETRQNEENFTLLENQKLEAEVERLQEQLKGRPTQAIYADKIVIYPGKVAATLKGNH